MTAVRTPLSSSRLLCFVCGLAIMWLWADGSVEAVSDEYVFVLDTQKYVAVLHDDTISIGQIDSTGNFVPDKRWLHVPTRQGLSGVPPFKLINDGREKQVYEFRSGRLIKGELDEKGNFIPEIGAKVMEFKEYHYSPSAPRIYNLPGYFKKKQDNKK